MYSLNLDSDNRIFSACICLEGQEYINIVDTLPESDITDYKYVDGEYVYDPLPSLEPTSPEPTTDDIINTLLGIKGEE